MAGIFDKQSELRPSAMRTVAERRFDDAQCLRDTNENARANGVAYLAGFVIEILLKARLVERYPAIARKRQHEVSHSELEIWSLIWRRHDLAGMVERMPDLVAGLRAKSERSGVEYNDHLRSVCGSWTIQARYSTSTITMTEARAMLDRVRVLKEVLK